MLHWQVENGLVDRFDEGFKAHRLSFAIQLLPQGAVLEDSAVPLSGKQELGQQLQGFVVPQSVGHKLALIPLRDTIDNVVERQGKPACFTIKPEIGALISETGSLLKGMGSAKLQRDSIGAPPQAIVATVQCVDAS
ncbi:hypothetical protein D3C76_1078590 [compost metagenome]